MNSGQVILIDSASRKVAPCKNLMKELASFGGTPPLATLEKYEKMLARVQETDMSISELTPPKNPAAEKKITDAMIQLEMLSRSVAGIADQLEAEVKEAKQNFLASSGPLLESMDGEETKNDESIVAAFRALAVELRKQWLVKARHLELSRYLTSVRNEHPPMGMQVAAPGEIRLAWTVVRNVEGDFYKEYLEQFTSKINAGPNLTYEYFKARR